jgi:hypothetical protein
MSTYLRAAGRVLVVLFAALIVGFSLFAFVQSVVHPVMGLRPRQQLTGQQPPAEGEREAPGRTREGEGGLPRRLRPRRFLGLFSRAAVFGIVTVGVLLVQGLFFGRRPRRPERS